MQRPLLMQNPLKALATFLSLQLILLLLINETCPFPVHLLFVKKGFINFQKPLFAWILFSKNFVMQILIPLQKVRQIDFIPSYAD